MKLLLVIPVAAVAVVLGWGQIFALRMEDMRAPEQARQRQLEQKRDAIENRRGAYCFAEGDLEGARRAYEQSLSSLRTHYGENDPSCGAVLTYLGEIAMEQGDQEKAKEHFTEAIRLLTRKENPYTDKLEKARAKLGRLGDDSPETTLPNDNPD